MEIKSLIVIDGVLHNTSHELNKFELSYHHPISNNVDYLGFNKKDNQLFVQFKNGKSYMYFDVSKEAIELWNTSRPAGNYLANCIKGYFRYHESDLFAEVASPTSVAEAYKKLLHHYDTTVGLYATDRPDLIKDEQKVLFQLS
jgi:hypothetical protein